MISLIIKFPTTHHRIHPLPATPPPKKKITTTLGFLTGSDEKLAPKLIGVIFSDIFYSDGQTDTQSESNEPRPAKLGWGSISIDNTTCVAASNAYIISFFMAVSKDRKV